MDEPTLNAPSLDQQSKMQSENLRVVGESKVNGTSAAAPHDLVTRGKREVSEDDGVPPPPPKYPLLVHSTWTSELPFSPEANPSNSETNPSPQSAHGQEGKSSTQRETREESKVDNLNSSKLPLQIPAQEQDNATSHAPLLGAGPKEKKESQIEPIKPLESQGQRQPPLRRSERNKPETDYSQGNGIHRKTKRASCIYATRTHGASGVNVVNIPD